MTGLVVFGAAHVDRLLMLPGPAIPGASNPARSVEHVGGVGLNLAATAARLGTTTIVSRIGSDAAGDRVLAEARAAGAAPSCPRSLILPTASYTAVLDGAGGLVIGLADMAIDDEIGGEDFQAPIAAAGTSEAWHVDANLPPAALAAVAAAKAGRRLSASAVSPAKAERLAPVLRAIDLLFCNRGEAEMLAGAPPGAVGADALAQRLRTAGVGAAIVTDGAAALGLADEAGTTRVRPPSAAAIVSASGAGDALAAGTLAGLAAGLPLRDALAWGLAAASLKLEVAEPARRDLTRGMLARRRSAIAMQGGRAAEDAA